MTQPHRFQFAAMTVPCEISILGGLRTTAETVAKSIHQSTKSLERTYNFYSDDSWLSRELNQRGASRVRLNPEQIRLFQRVRDLSELTAGLFDPTIGTIKLASWDRPDASRTQLVGELEPAMGLDSWQLDGDYLVFRDTRTAFDLGGVIKEYAVDVAASLASQAGVNCLINFGGDMHVKGRKPNGDYVAIGVKDPLSPDRVLCTLAVENAGLTTSGFYERTVTIGGEQGTHIIGNRQTKSASILSATVIAPSTLEAGVFSTALMLDPALTVPEHIQYIVVGEGRKIYSNLPSLPG
ncbi:MAG: thiamine biosynthesis protein ApbE [Gammaproteobacteria bacterium]|nr:MAG: thiamine biosynthesis protein ApbE [Gammaproteobacteria bacterium]